ncbi:regulator of nucleoside diphosphate kinase [Maritalea mobilis]|jgi:regulator of nucleoside diphosphate kinase|uniref:Regulator of nucleoside diphosphate kinase n=1 Tax=Maritalea mobilis TaxID=483324 RepID=A0A4V3DB05_9HYPH|nr:nucleoside diphosphate kinase regulator [Maritalea mobilis]TDQ64464.1 regulator of nucleoside diphosphate kinase [Maritalea mobilis]
MSVKYETKLPEIFIGDKDFEQLNNIAEAATGAASDVADQLMDELERAVIVSQAKLSDEVVQMGSYVSFITSDGFDRSFQLVLPRDADVSNGKISILTPIGAALIGLSGGQTIPWKTSDGRILDLTVRTVSQVPPPWR